MEVYHAADSRGSSQLAWLESRHSFSFADYYCPERIRFGALRVLNDDIVKPGMGFGTHPHQDMEIISIPLKGAMKHKDDTGQEEVIREGDVQVMSAGKGILHSEFNASTEDDVHFLQVWIYPDTKEVEPVYSQKSFPKMSEEGGEVLLVSPVYSDHDTLKIHQNAYVSQIQLNEGGETTYQKYANENGVYLFLVEGEVQVKDRLLYARDGFGLDSEDNIKIKAKGDVKLLIFEIPMM